jgi:hypothetical protein
LFILVSCCCCCSSSFPFKLFLFLLSQHCMPNGVTLSNWPAKAPRSSFFQV